MRSRDEPDAARRSEAAASGAAGVIAAVVISIHLAQYAAQTTARIAFNDGFGYLDGMTYAAMVNELRGKIDVDFAAPYVFRILPIELVARSAASLVDGFLFVNVVGFLVSGVFMYALLRHYRVAPTLAVLAVAWFCVLPAGLRFGFYYPTLIDGIGYAFLVALLYLAVKGRYGLFALVLPFAVLTRENLVALVPFLFLANVRRDGLQAVALTLGAAIPGFLAYELIRLVPIITPAQPADVFGDMQRNLGWFQENASERQWRYMAAPILTLGLLQVLPLIRPLALTRFALGHLEWPYYVGVTLAMSVVGGGDYDRFALWLAPALLVIGFRIGPSRGWVAFVAWPVLTMLHFSLSGFFEPLGTSESAYRESTAALMPVSHLFERTAAFLPVLVVGWTIGALASLAIWLGSPIPLPRFRLGRRDATEPAHHHTASRGSSRASTIR